MNTLGLYRKVSAFGLGTNIIDGIIILGDGILIASTATINGIGQRILEAAGVLASSPAIINGLGNRILEAIGNLISSNATLTGLDIIPIEIRRAFKVGISLTQTFMTNIAAKIKIKVNK